jgi:cysteinyl-tRNA synthetase
MSKKYLGDKFDIHGGGIDLIFPHHENEIAQSRCANNTEVFANYWVHNGFITMSNEKMAKSQGNILLIKEVKEWGAGQVLRLALMSSHYRQPLDWNEKLFQDCKNTIEKWYQVDATEVMFGYPDGKRLLEKSVKIPDEYLAPLYDDLNTPGYITNLHKLFDKAINGSENDKKIFISACNFVGLLVESKADWAFARLTAASIEAKVINEKVELLNKARENKDYVEADKIRKELVDNGIAIENKDGKTVWKLK